MATRVRTAKEIYDGAVAILQSETPLSAIDITGADDADTYLQTIFNNPSQASIVGHLLWLFSRIAQTEDEIRNLYEQEIEIAESQAVYGTPEWWSEKLLEFQYGDQLQITELSDGKILVGYSLVDETKKIIKRASVSPDGEGGSIFKVAEENNGDLQALPQNKLLSVRSFVNKIAPAGSKIDIRSRNSDLVRYYISVFYDPLVNLEDIGDDLGIKTNVEAAINNYHKNLVFDGSIDLRKLSDFIQEVEGVATFSINTAEAKEIGGVYTSFNPSFNTVAGYVKVDDLFPLSDTIEYIPNVS